MEILKYIFVMFMIIILQPITLHSQDNASYTFCPKKCRCDMIQDSINCSYSQLEDLPSGIYDETKYLDLSNNEIKAISFEIKTLVLLRNLSLAYNQISKLTPGCFNGLNELEILDLSYNDFKVWSFLLPSRSFAHLESLKILDLSGNNLREIFHFSSENLISTSLHELYLRNCKISNIANKSILSNLTSLKTLIMSNNLLESFPGLSSKSLQTLDISKCKLQLILTDAFADLPKLLHLNASNNHNLRLMKHKPRSTSIRSAAFENCGITIKYLSDFPNLTKMYLHGNKLHYLENDTFINNLHLHYIDLSNTDLSDISGFAFRNLKNLTELNLSRNAIRKLDPNVFVTNVQLVNVDMSYNYFTEVVKLYSKSISMLDMSTCEIETIKNDVLLKLPALKELKLTHNWISILPENLKSPSLEILDLSNCRLKFVTNVTFISLESLIRLKLNNNFFTDEFSSIMFPRTIEKIELYNNYWYCNCFSPEFRQFYEYLMKPPVKSDIHRLICFTPRKKRHYNWAHACQEEWSVHPPAPNKWMLMVVMFVTIIALFCIILFAKKLINDQYERNRRIEDESRRIDGLERLRRLREQIRESSSNAQLNAPDPRESQSPPTYEEALLMQRPIHQTEQNGNTPKNSNVQATEITNTNNEESNESIKSESDITEEQTVSASNRSLNNINTETSTRINSTSFQEHHF